MSRQQATVGPCLAELDPAVAQASQHRLQNMSDQDFSNFTNLLSPFRRQIRPNQQAGSIRRSQYGLDAMSLENVARSHRTRCRSEISFVCDSKGRFPHRPSDKNQSEFQSMYLLLIENLIDFYALT